MPNSLLSKKIEQALLSNFYKCRLSSISIYYRRLKVSNQFCKVSIAYFAYLSGHNGQPFTQKNQLLIRFPRLGTYKGQLIANMVY